MHAGEQSGDVRGNELLDPKECRRSSLSGAVLSKLDEPGKCGRQLDAGEALFSLRIPYDEGKVEAHVGNVGKRAPGIHRQRREHRKDDLLEIPVSFAFLLCGKLCVITNADSRLFQKRKEVAQACTGLMHQVLRSQPHGLQLRRRAHSRRRIFDDTCLDLLLESCHAHHEELGEIRAHDGQELHALQQRVGGIPRLLQHAPEEIEERQLPVDEEPRLVQVDHGLTHARALRLPAG